MRQQLITAMAERILALPGRDRRRIAIDGVDGVGKSCFARELAGILTALGGVVITASADDFLHPRSIRYRLGRDSPLGYFQDSVDVRMLQRDLLIPLGPGGSGRYRIRAFDHHHDCALPPDFLQAPEGTILVLDGLFLHRPSLAGTWDLSVFLAARFASTFQRMALRDGRSPDPDAPSNRRYRQGQELYLALEPERQASVVIDHDDPEHPRLISAEAGQSLAAATH